MVDSPAENDDDTYSLLERQRRAAGKPSSNFVVYVVFVFPALAGFLFGFDIGATSGAVESLLGALDGDLRHSSPLLVGTLIGSVVEHVIREHFTHRIQLSRRAYEDVYEDNGHDKDDADGGDGGDGDAYERRRALVRRSQDILARSFGRARHDD